MQINFKSMLKNIEKFNDTPSSLVMMKNSFKELSPKGGLGLFSISLLVATILSLAISLSPETVPLLKSVLDLFLNIVLSVFGIVLTVYSIVFAFLDDNTLGFLSSIEDNQLATDRQEDVKEAAGHCPPNNEHNIASYESYLSKRLMYFQSLLLLYFLALMLTILLVLLTFALKDDFILTDAHWLNNLLAFICLFPYLFYIVRLLLELKNVVYNTVTLFYKSIAIRLIEKCKGEMKHGNK